MTDKIDFSQLVQAEEGLISWEDLFPEYAVGGESFKSGQVHSKSFNTSSDQDDMTAVVSDDNVAVTAERFQEHVPVVEMSSLPDIPSFTEDDITWDDDGDLFSSEKTQQTTVSQPQTSTLDDSIFTMDGHTADSALSINEDWLERALSAVDGELAQRQKTVKDQDYWTHRFNEMNHAVRRQGAYVHLRSARLSCASSSLPEVRGSSVRMPAAAAGSMQESPELRRPVHR